MRVRLAALAAGGRRAYFGRVQGAFASVVAVGALALGAPAASAAVTITSPQEGQTVGSSFQFAGTAGADPSVNDQKDARKLGCLTCSGGAAIADFNGSATGGVTELLSYGLVVPSVTAIKNVYSFPIAKSVHARLVLHVNVGNAPTQTVTKPIAFKWPKQASDHHGRGDKGLITRISGPRKVKLSRKTQRFKIKFSRHFKHTRKDAYFVQVAVETPGGHFSRGGVVFLTLGYSRVIPIQIKGKGNAEARKLAPLPAHLVIRLAPKYGHGPQDIAFYDFRLVR